MTDGQMTFLPKLNSSRELELYIPPNPSVKKADIPRLSRQSQRILERLEQGSATTGELADIALQYAARTNECRHYLAKRGEMIDMVEGEGGENLYEIVPLEQSTFWKKVKEKKEMWKWL